jgi:hypothetical protein
VPTFLICVCNQEYAASLELLKLYRQLPDGVAQRQGLVRIIDESAEDYLYPATYFWPVKLTSAKRKTLAKVARHAA